MAHRHVCTDRIKKILRKFFDNDERLVNAWLNSPTSALSGYVPQALIDGGNAEMVCSALEAAYGGDVCS